jgi:hypothetical protein
MQEFLDQIQWDRTIFWCPKTKKTKNMKKQNRIIFFAENWRELHFFTEPARVMVSEFLRFFRREIFLFIRLEMFFHLPYDVLRFVVIPHIEIHLRILELIGMTASRAEFPLLEPVHVRKLRAHRATDDHVHYYVLCACWHLKNISE